MVTGPADPAQGSRRVLMAVAAGRVRRGPVAGNANTAGSATAGNATAENAGRYLLDGAECVDAALVSLVGNDLVSLPAGNESPRLTPDGEAVLTNFT